MRIKKIMLAAFLGTIIAAAPISTMSSQQLITAEAHQGRTDANGGHHDYKNKSGLGSYHYHCGGNPAHLHPNGVCPYGNSNAADTAPASKPAENPNAANTQAVSGESTGWQKDETGWRYKNSGTTYLQNSLVLIDGYYYYFDSNGYMKTGWQTINREQYYFDANGHMLTGYCLIDGIYYNFDADGTLDDDDYDDYDDYDDNYDDDNYDYDNDYDDDWDD